VGSDGVAELACDHSDARVGRRLVDDAVCAIRALRADDPEVISAAMAALGWDKPVSQYER
jgi:hypothetical protein